MLKTTTLIKITAFGILIIATVVKLWTAVYLSPFLKFRNLNYIALSKVKKSLSKEKFSFVIASDPKRSQIAFGKIINYINHMKDVDFTVIGGDITEDSEKLEYALFMKKLRELRKPAVVIPGNHDVRKAGRAWFYNIFGSFYFYVCHNKRLFVFLDDSDKRHPFAFEMDWLRKTLANCNQANLKVIFMHIPIYDPRKSNKIGHSIRNPRYADYLIKLLEKYRINVVFASHIHSYYQGYWGNLKFFITGGAGYENPNINPHFLKVSVNKDKLTVKPIKVKLTRIERFFDKILDHAVFPSILAIERNFSSLITLCALLILLI